MNRNQPILTVILSSILILSSSFTLLPARGLSTQSANGHSGEEYIAAVKQCVSVLRATQELIKEERAKKGKDGAFVSEASRTEGAQVLKKYGDARLVVEELLSELRSKEDEKSAKILKASEGILKIMLDGRDMLLDSYQNPDDKDLHKANISKLQSYLGQLDPPKGIYKIKLD